MTPTCVAPTQQCHESAAARGSPGRSAPGTPRGDALENVRLGLVGTRRDFQGSKVPLDFTSDAHIVQFFARWHEFRLEAC